MESKERTRQQEEFHLQETLAVAEKELQTIWKSIEDMEAEMQKEKLEARENITYGIQDMSSSDDFEAFVELSQSMSHVDKMVADYDEYRKRVKMLQTLIKTPYFARIDFRFEDGETEAIYIGRRSLSDRVSREICIYDWRAPIASVFYRFTTGDAYYDAPCGRIDGELMLKRQFEIKNSKLEYFFDSDRAINDEILRQLLSQNTSPKMKAIVETIQSEQDVVIRDMENDLLMVQGVAGSGKTSIALHRAAYLMYQGTQAGLTADSILILSPNSTFEDYIAGVLPELGEENITSAVFETLLQGILKDRTIQPHYDYLEQIMANNEGYELAGQSMKLKTSGHFLELLNFYMENLPEYGIEYRDVFYHGKCIITKKQMKEWLLKRPQIPLGSRLRLLQEYITELAFGTGKKHAPAEEIAAFSMQLQEFLTLDIFELYRSFLAYESNYEELLAEVDSAETLDAILKATVDSLEYGPIPYDDAMVLTYLTLKFREKGMQRHIKHVVIDEAQDYYPIQFEIIHLLFPNAKYTVLGDINQTLDKQEDMHFYNQVRERLHKKKSSLVTLTKSFRCTNEILNFSLRYLNQAPELESFNRSGDSPAFVSSKSAVELAANILREIRICKEKGYESICLISKSARDAEKLQKLLLQEIGKSSNPSDSELIPKLILNYTDEDLTGVLSLPVYLSKGLEFDAVLICDADSFHFKDENDRKLLYVASTRALHHLGTFRTVGTQ
ncbi:MAG: HelD family protein [Acetatifactor sp.]